MIKKNREKNRLKTGIKLVNQIQKTRFNNNKNWMDLLKLSLQLDYRKTSKILKDIVSDDKKISISLSYN